MKKNKIILAKAKQHAKMKISRIVVPLIYVLSVPLFIKFSNNVANILLLILGATSLNQVIINSVVLFTDPRQHLKDISPLVKEAYHEALKRVHGISQEAQRIKNQPKENFTDYNFINEANKVINASQEAIREHQDIANRLTEEMKELNVPIILEHNISIFMAQAIKFKLLKEQCLNESQLRQDYFFEQKIKEAEHMGQIAANILTDLKLIERITVDY